MTSQRLLKTYQTQTDLALSLPKASALTALPNVASDTPFGMERENMEALKIQPTSSQNPPEPPPLQKEAGGEEEERLSSTPMQVSLSKNFAGRLRHFASAWMSLTEDKNILDTVQHCHVKSGIWIRFCWQVSLHQYTCLPNGLSSAPRVILSC